MRFFLAGIIQGSICEKKIHEQDYRKRVRAILEQAFPGDEIFCPFDNHPDSINYAPRRGRDVFLDLIEKAAASDVVVAYLPEASMGTAIEIWEAHKANKIVVSISPMKENWAVKFLSDAIVPDMDSFADWVRRGELKRLIESKKSEGDAA